MKKIIKLRDDNIRLLEHLLDKLKQQTEPYGIQAWMHSVAAHTERTCLKIDQAIEQLQSKGEL